MQTERAKNQHYLFIYFGGERGGGGVVGVVVSYLMMDAKEFQALPL